MLSTTSLVTLRCDFIISHYWKANISPPGLVSPCFYAKPGKIIIDILFCFVILGDGSGLLEESNRGSICFGRYSIRGKGLFSYLLRLVVYFSTSAVSVFSATMLSYFIFSTLLITVFIDASDFALLLDFWIIRSLCSLYLQTTITPFVMNVKFMYSES